MSDVSGFVWCIICIGTRSRALGNIGVYFWSNLMNVGSAPLRQSKWKEQKHCMVHVEVLSGF